MKFNMKKVAAAALAMTMCIPGAAFAAQNPTSGNFETSFDVYSPALTVSVPVKLDVRVNPISDSNATDVKKFDVASNSIDIMNASVDVKKDVAIPVNVTVKANISSTADDVVTEYNSFTADTKSTVKRIYLELSEANTKAVFGLAAKEGGGTETAAFDGEKKLDLTKYEVSTAAQYNSVANKASITKYGSLLSVDIAGPATSNTTDTGETFSKNASDVTAAVGSFAVTGVANTNADWNASDVTVAVTYNVKASKALAIKTPTLTAAATGSTTAGSTITVSDVGEAKVIAFAIHNDEAEYKDYVWTEVDGSVYKIEYVANATDNTKTDAKITIDKTDPGLVFIGDAANGLKNKPQDLVIALSDGRFVVSTLTVQ